MKHIWWFLLPVFLLLPALSSAETSIQGRGCVSFGKERSLEEARLLVRGVAVRRAIESTGVLGPAEEKCSSEFVADIVQILRSGHLQGIRVLEHEEAEATVCETVEAFADLTAMRRAVIRVVERRAEQDLNPALGDNKCLRILAIEEDEDRYGRRVNAVVGVKRATGPLHTPELRLGKPCFKVCVDYLGSGGVPAGGDALFVDDSPEGMVRGEMRTLSFHVPDRIQSYRVWLPPDKPTESKAVPAAAPDPTGAARPIEDVVAAVTETGILRVEVISDGPINRHDQFFMSKPPRLVIDLPGRWERPRFHAREIESPLVERVRIGHHPAKLRLVLDLRKGEAAPSAVIREIPTGLSVEIRPR